MYTYRTYFSTCFHINLTNILLTILYKSAMLTNLPHVYFKQITLLSNGYTNTQRRNEDVAI